MYIDTDTPVMKDQKTEPARLDIKEYVKQICDEADRRSAERTALFNKAMGITDDPPKLTPTEDKAGRPDTLTYLKGIDKDKTDALQENAALLKKTLDDEKADALQDMKDDMEKAARDAVEAVKQDYIRRGLYKQTGAVNYQPVIHAMYGNRETEREARHKEVMTNFLKDIDSKRDV